MKKVFCAVLALAMLLSIIPFAVSAATASPWETSGTKFNVFENWDTVADSTDKAANAYCNLYIKDGKIVIDKILKQENTNNFWWARVFDLAATVDANSAEGMGFYVENNTSNAQSIIPRFYIGNKWATMKPNATVYRYDSATQTVTATTTSVNRTIGIPAGFKGFVAFPYESVHWDRNEAADHIGKTLSALKSANELKFTSLGFVVGGVNLAESSGEQLIMDNFFIYGKNITEKNDGVIPTAVQSNEDKIKENIKTIKKDMEAFTKVTPEVEYIPQYDSGNVKALLYEGAAIDGKPTKVFAYIGYPSNMEANKKYPAVVLVHGGGGHAFPDWVKKWTAQGYIAIAMDNVGFFPTSTNNNPNNGTNWEWGFSTSPFAEEGYGNVPNCDNYSSLMQSPDKQWMYHAVAQTILAKGILEADSKVDASKIGVVGISWGSKITACAIGYEKFAFAVCQYVAGHLEYAQNHNEQYSKLTGYEQWKADSNFDKVDYPVLFQQWTYDSSASIKSTSKCYEDLMPEGAIMSLRTSWAHYHDWNTPIETYRFADSIVKNGNPLTTFKTQPDGSYYVDCNISVPSDATKVTAKVQYVTEKLTYKAPVRNGDNWKPEQTFKSADLTVKDGRVYGAVPSDAVEYYVEITTVAGGKTYYTASLYKTADKNIDPCKNGHSYVNGKCERCGNENPTVTNTPTETPTEAPAETPTVAPSEEITEVITQTPTEAVTQAPTESASDEASAEPGETATESASDENQLPAWLIPVAAAVIVAAVAVLVVVLVKGKKKQ